MSYNSDLQKNNTALGEILKTVNKLPNANSTPSEAVLYVAQELTDEQKAQARENIGVGEEYRAKLIQDVLKSIGCPIFGVVDENKNIVLTGTLSDGSYYIKYEMEDGSTVDIGQLVLDTNVYYSVTNNLTNCTSNNGATQAIGGESYSATITANDGYELKSVVVTIGGANVSVSGGVINITNVTGDIVITAVAEVSGPAYINQIPISINSDGSLFVGTNGEKGYKTNTRISFSSGNETSQSGVEVTCFIPIKEGDTVYIKGLTISESATTQTLAFYNSNFEMTKTGGASQSGVYTGVVFGEVNGEIKSLVFNHANIQNNNFNSDVAYIRLSAGEINADSILTINQPIT